MKRTILYSLLVIPVLLPICDLSAASSKHKEMYFEEEFEEREEKCSYREEDGSYEVEDGSYGVEDGSQMSSEKQRGEGFVGFVKGWSARLRDESNFVCCIAWELVSTVLESAKGEVVDFVIDAWAETIEHENSSVRKSAWEVTPCLIKRSRGMQTQKFVDAWVHASQDVDASIRFDAWLYVKTLLKIKNRNIVWRINRKRVEDITHSYGVHGDVFGVLLSNGDIGEMDKEERRLMRDIDDKESVAKFILRKMSAQVYLLHCSGKEEMAECTFRSALLMSNHELGKQHKLTKELKEKFKLYFPEPTLYETIKSLLFGLDEKEQQTTKNKTN